jgi:flagellar hook-basal body complex protein FliE
MQPIATDLSGAANSAAALPADAAASDLRRPAGPEGPVADAAAPFSAVLKDAMANLDGLERQASAAVQGLVEGRGVDIHQAMIATQKSDLAFEAALAVRGKMVSAFQSIMGVQF